jgi:hypothetical protein
MFETAAWTCGAFGACVTDGRYSAKPGESTAPQDRGYTAIGALALVVEAAEALSTFLSDCDPWP